MKSDESPQRDAIRVADQDVFALYLAEEKILQYCGLVALLGAEGAARR